MTVNIDTIVFYFRVEQLQYSEFLMTLASILATYVSRSNSTHVLMNYISWRISAYLCTAA